MGWETERGKLIEFNHLLRGDPGEPYLAQVRKRDILPHIRSVMTLDIDTSLPQDSARRLVGAPSERKKGNLQISPCIPGDWRGYELVYKDGGTSHQISVENPYGISQGVKQIVLDAKTLSGVDTPLLGDGKPHNVRVEMG